MIPRLTARRVPPTENVISDALQRNLKEFGRIIPGRINFELDLIIGMTIF